jgi:hypothetical protein
LLSNYFPYFKIITKKNFHSTNLTHNNFLSNLFLLLNMSSSISKKRYNPMRPSAKRRKDNRRQVGRNERRKKEQHAKMAERLEVRAAIGTIIPTLETTNPNWTVDYDDRIRVISQERDDAVEQAMKGKTWDVNDPIFTDFKIINGFHENGGIDTTATSGTVVVKDHDSGDIVLVVRFTKFIDATADKWQRMKTLFSYIQADKAFHNEITINHARTHGKIKAFGWRAGTDRGVAFGNYTITDTADVDDAESHLNDSAKIHDICAQSFHELSPRFHFQACEQRRQRSIPIFGYIDTTDPDDMKVRQLYSPNATYTFGKCKLSEASGDVSILRRSLYSAKGRRSASASANHPQLLKETVA